MMSTQIELPSPVWRRLNLTWVAFFVVSGAVNIYVAYNFSEDTWVNFKLFGVLGLTIAFIIIQAFYISRHLPDEALAEADDGVPESDSADKRER
jgi:intracellular septation protein